MKYLKIFEGSKNSLMDIYSDDIKECFYDLSDNGWVINTRFAKKMFSSKGKFSFQKVSNGEMDLELLPYIEVKIHKKFRPNGTPVNSSVTELQDLQESILYKECMNIFKSVLDEHGLFISQEKVERLSSGGSQIYILIYRKSDENYTK